MSLFNNMKDMMNMAAKAKEIQANLRKAQEEIQKMTETLTDGANGVSVTVSGDFFVTDIKVEANSPLLAQPDALEKVMKDTLNQAISSMKMRIQARMKDATGGVDIPGLMG